MVTFVKTFYYKEEAWKFGQEVHEALAGSPAYINNEIVLNVSPISTLSNRDIYQVTLMVGNDTDHNKYIEL